MVAAVAGGYAFALKACSDVLQSSVVHNVKKFAAKAAALATALSGDYIFVRIPNSNQELL